MGPGAGPGPGQPAHGDGEAVRARAAGCGTAVPADGVPGAEPAGGALAGDQGACPVERADAGSGRLAAAGVRPPGGHDAPPAAEDGRCIVRILLATYLVVHPASRLTPGT